METLVAASSSDNGIVRDGDRLIHRQAGAPDQEIVATNADTFVLAAVAKWGMYRVEGGAPAPAAPFPVELVKTSSGEYVFHLRGGKKGVGKYHTKQMEDAPSEQPKTPTPPTQPPKAEVPPQPQAMKPPAQPPSLPPSKLASTPKPQIPLPTTARQFPKVGNPPSKRAIPDEKDSLQKVANVLNRKADRSEPSWIETRDALDAVFDLFRNADTDEEANRVAELLGVKLEEVPLLYQRLESMQEESLSLMRTGTNAKRTAETAERIKKFVGGDQIFKRVHSIEYDQIHGEHERIVQKTNEVWDRFAALENTPNVNREELEAARQELYKMWEKRRQSDATRQQEVEKARSRLVEAVDGKRHPLKTELNKLQDDVLKKHFEDGSSWLAKVVVQLPEEQDIEPYVVKQIKGRANYTEEDRKVSLAPNNDAGITVHELGHHLEHQILGIWSAAASFRRYRVKDEKPTNLANEFPANNYDDDEEGYRDEFGKHFQGSAAYYVGKVYPGGRTEIVSMGLEALYRDPIKFYRDDPEYAKFIVGILTGELRY